MDLTKKKCVPCERGTPPLVQDEVDKFLKEVPKWGLTRDGKVYRNFQFKDFRGALSFVNRVGQIAEKEGHHPDIKIVYNRVTLELITHSIGGLSENDFILAAKIERLGKIDK